MVLHASSFPKPDTQLATEAGGGFANCWIDFREETGAEQLAKFYLAQEGWNYEGTDEAKWVNEETYDDNSDGLQHFLEAETNSTCFVVHSWPVNGEDDDSDE